MEIQYNINDIIKDIPRLSMSREKWFFKELVEKAG